MTPALRVTLACVIAFVAGSAAVAVGSARAEQQAIDRALVERLVRAEEAQTRALEALTRSAERCKR